MGTLVVDDFPDELQDQAESRAALEGITFRDLVIHAVKSYLRSPITLDVEEVLVKKRDSEEE